MRIQTFKPLQKVPVSVFFISSNSSISQCRNLVVILVFSSSPLGSDDIHISGFVSRRPETSHFDKTFLYQFGKAKVKFTQTNAHLSGHLPLGKMWVVIENFEEALADFLLVNRVHRMND